MTKPKPRRGGRKRRPIPGETVLVQGFECKAEKVDKHFVHYTVKSIRGWYARMLHEYWNAFRAKALESKP
jgi:hypothetical protein